MRSKSTISLIAWDLDNTLVQRDAAFRECIISMSESFAVAGRVLDDKALARILAFDRSGNADRFETMSLVASEFGLPVTQAARIWAAFQSLLPGFIQCDTAVLRVLEKLAGSFEFALVTNGSGPFQRSKFERAGLTPFFRDELILVSGELGFEKPDSRIFQELIRRGDCFPHEILFVGDDLQKDITGARAAGMWTCWVSGGGGAVPGPDSVIGHVAELEFLLENAGCI